jgi:hypothetical protein
VRRVGFKQIVNSMIDHVIDLLFFVNHGVRILVVGVVCFGDLLLQTSRIIGLGAWGVLHKWGAHYEICIE